jgi:quinol monooxygenase YgiN
MIHPAKVVSIHPYFRVKPGQLAAAKAKLSEFIAMTAQEPGHLYYDFTIREDVIFCREAYAGADGLLQHLDNVGKTLEEFLKLAEVIRLEVHGATAELDKLKAPLAGLNPEWFTYECGVVR